MMVLCYSNLCVANDKLSLKFIINICLLRLISN
jgi:hypothetical protein